MINLKDLRLEKGKTLKEMAYMLGIGITTYYMYETSERDIPYEVAKKIALIFDLEVEDIFLPTRFTVSKQKEDK